jgi:hypothetical protein
VLDFLGGAPKAVVPDNFKAGIAKSSGYEPGISETEAGAKARRRANSALLTNLGLPEIIADSQAYNPSRFRRRRKANPR